MKHLGPAATLGSHLTTVSDLNNIQNTAPTPRRANDRWYNSDTGQEYIAVLNAGATLVWVETGGGATGSGETTFGVEASRPTTGAFIGHNYYATDTFRRFEWDGTGWICLFEPEKTYTVALTATTTNPNIGTTGTASGLWHRANGRAYWRLNVTFLGTGITAGSGNYRVPIPTNRAAITGGFEMVGSGWWYNSTTGFSVVTADASPGSNLIRMIAAQAAAGEITNAFPGAPGAGSVLTLHGDYPMSSRYT